MQVIGYTTAGREFEVRDAIREEGIQADVPRLVRAVSKGKKRRPELVTEAYLPNYVFIDVSVDDYITLISIKGLVASTLLHVPIQYERILSRWMDGIEATAATQQARHAQGETLAEYVAGDALKVTDGPLMAWLEGQRVTFDKIADSASRGHLVIKAEVEVMGQVTTLELDPLHVRAAE